MRKPLFTRQQAFITLMGLLLVLLLAACGASANGSPSSSPTSAATTPTVAAATATEQALVPQMTLVGQPTAKLVTGHHTFEVSGTIKNGDSKQHDIYVQATLLDATGAIVGETAFFNVDNVPGGKTESFVIQGTTIQSTWARVQVKVVGLTENIGSSGGD
ncbi:MAG TPA: FxLYD domain-containing protein [Ktedonobacteraceae bacterium]